MKRSRNAIFKYTIVVGAAMSLSACNGIFENIYDAPIETEMEIKENSFSQVKTVEYTEWAYINLSERTVTTVKIGEEYESQIPDKWDFAIHRYDIKPTRVLPTKQLTQVSTSLKQQVNCLKRKIL